MSMKEAACGFERLRRELLCVQLAQPAPARVNRSEVAADVARDPNVRLN
jgi:hypothetical protein